MSAKEPTGCLHCAAARPKIEAEARHATLERVREGVERLMEQSVEDGRYRIMVKDVLALLDELDR